MLIMKNSLPNGLIKLDIVIILLIIVIVEAIIKMYIVFKSNISYNCDFYLIYYTSFFIFILIGSIWGQEYDCTESYKDCCIDKIESHECNKFNNRCDSYTKYCSNRYFTYLLITSLFNFILSVFYIIL